MKSPGAIRPLTIHGAVAGISASESHTAGNSFRASAVDVTRGFAGTAATKSFAVNTAPSGAFCVACFKVVPVNNSGAPEARAMHGRTDGDARFASSARPGVVLVRGNDDLRTWELSAKELRDGGKVRRTERGHAPTT